MNEVSGFREAFVCISRPGRRKIEYRCPDHGSHVQINGTFGGNLRIEILVTKTGHAALEHFSYRVLGAVADHFGAYPALLMRPNALPEPLLQGHILNQAAKQCHCRMGMGIDEAWNEEMVRPLNEDPRFELLARLLHGQDGDDTAVGYNYCMIVEDNVMGLDWDTPAGSD